MIDIRLYAESETALGCITKDALALDEWTILLSAKNIWRSVAHNFHPNDNTGIKIDEFIKKMILVETIEILCFTYMDFEPMPYKRLCRTKGRGMRCPFYQMSKNIFYKFNIWR